MRRRLTRVAFATLSSVVSIVTWLAIAISLFGHTSGWLWWLLYGFVPATIGVWIGCAFSEKKV